jgi:DnaJ family protein C protein 13
MQARKDMIGVVCEALNRLFSTNQDQLISQVDAQYLPSIPTMNY